MVLAATPNQPSSGQLRCCSTSTFEKHSMALMLCPSVLSTPTLMGHFYSVNVILKALLTRAAVEALEGGAQVFCANEMMNELVL